MTKDFQPPPSPRSQTANGWTWLAIGCGGLTLLVMGLAGLGAFILARNVGFSGDPAQVEAKARTLFNYTIPGGSTGYMTMNMFGMELVQIASSETPPEVLLIVGSLPAYAQSKNTRDDFIQDVQEGYSGTNADGEAIHQWTGYQELCGQDISVTVTVEQANSSDPDAPITMVSYATTIDYNNRVLFASVVATGDRPMEKADSVFNSLECQ